MNKQEYNGWTNYETWNVHLWITGNDQGTYDYWREQTELCLDTPGEILDATYALSVALKAEHIDNIPETLKGVYADLLGAALSEVNWTEIAQSLIDEVTE